MLGVCIFVHEFGHYLFGRLVGVQAEIFSIGYGRGFWKKKIGVTTWQIGTIPLGGYVKFYGDDIQKHDSNIPGGFFSVPPLVRIIPVLGGPVFNLLLGALIFGIFHTISGPVSSKIAVPSYLPGPARLSGLQSDDKIIAINGQQVNSFDEISQIVALSGGKRLKIKIERNHNGKTTTMEKDVSPHTNDSGISFIGVRPAGPVSIHVSFPTGKVIAYRFKSLFMEPELPTGLKAMKYLRDGDVILSVEGEKVNSVPQIQNILGNNHGKEVMVRVSRESLPFLTWRFHHIQNVRMPSSPEYIIHLKNIVDQYYGNQITDRSLVSYQPDHERGLSQLRINGMVPKSFAYLNSKFTQSEQVKLVVGKNNYQARLEVKKIGLLGFIPSQQIQTVYLPTYATYYEMLQATGRDLSNSIMVYPTFFARIFSGRMSFIENAAGPVKIIGIAGMVARSDWRMYLKIFASISIALFIMNLLPFPILDGGHIVFFLYEAVAGRPVSAKIMEGIYRFGFSILIMLGLCIMYRDILWTLGV